MTEAARYLGLSVATLRGYIHKGRITPDVRLPRAHGFLRSTLEAFKHRPRGAGRHSRRLDHAAILRRYQAGEKARAIAADVGCTTEYVYRLVGRARREAA